MCCEADKLKTIWASVFIDSFKRKNMVWHVVLSCHLTHFNALAFNWCWEFPLYRGWFNFGLRCPNNRRFWAHENELERHKMYLMQLIAQNCAYKKLIYMCVSSLNLFEVNFDVQWNIRIKNTVACLLGNATVISEFWILRTRFNGLYQLELQLFTL
jgi:hypothetical protein